VLPRAWILTIIVFACAPLHADERKELQKRLQEKYVQQSLFIRNFYGGDDLVFDSQGNLMKGDKTLGYRGSWAAAAIYIEKVELRKDKLILRGRRVIECYCSEQWEPQRLPHNPKIQIEIELDADHIEQTALTAVLEKVFLNQADDMICLIPDAWRAEGFQPLEKHFFKTGEGVGIPKGINTLDPEYSDDARAGKLQGTVVLWLAIDEQGNPVEIKILRCLGRGLDEKSIEAVKTWKFEPARKHGQPVAVQMNVELTFHLYN